MKKYIAIGLLFLSQITISQTHYSQINLESKSYDEFKILDDTLDDYSIYFTGENHLFATFNTEFQFKFLTYLYQTQHVRHFIFEQSPAVGYIIEKVIIDKKTTHLNYLKDMFYTPFYDLVKHIKKFNDTLAVEDKIRIHGIDAERFPYFSIYALSEIVDTLDTRFEGGDLFEQIKALASANYLNPNVGTYYAEPEFDFNFDFGQVSPWASLNSIIQGANDMHDTLAKRLGNDAEIFFAIIKSLEVGKEWYLAEKAGDIKSPIVRERYMCDEFERIYKKDPTGKYYGQFGRCHTHKDEKSRGCYDYYMNSIANRISQINPGLKNQVLVIPIFYTQNKKMDQEEIEALDLDDEFLVEGESFIIDLEYKNGNHTITGFYDLLPFIIVSNVAADGYEEDYFSWHTQLEEFHLGGYYGYRYFNRINKLNSALENIGAIGFTNKFTAYTFAMDYISMNEVGGRGTFTYIPAVSNGDRFQLNGYLATMGSYYPFGNKFIMAAIGYDLGYGRMQLREETDNTVPNLIQKGGKNLMIYTNDVFVLDPNVEFRLTLPVISFNLKAGYCFDVSGKYWKLDGKMKDFTKTSFSSPYIQFGASLNFKTR